MSDPETLWMDYSVPDSSVRGILQESWSGLPCPSPRHLSNPGIEPASLTSPILAGGEALVKQIKGLNVSSGKSIPYAVRFLPSFGLE